MSQSKYICLTALLFILSSCTSSPKQENETREIETPVSESAITTQERVADTVVVENVKEAAKPVEITKIAKKVATPDNDVPDEEYPSGTMFVNNSYLILQSTTSYSAAMNTARKASEELGYELNYRGYVFDFKAGLRDTATCGCGEIHEYVPRGRYDDGNYVSIEHTNSFTEFTDGYYIVVAGSGKRSTLKPLLAKAQQFYGDAYIKDAEVYLGCLH